MVCKTSTGAVCQKTGKHGFASEGRAVMSYPLMHHDADMAISTGMSQSWVRNIENKLQDKPLKPVYAEQLRKILKLS